MKKIGLWMATLTAVTVGGVYATFNYAENFEFSKTEETAIGIEAAAPAGAVGSYTVDVSNFKVTVDSAESLGFTQYDVHKAMLAITGDITITFKPTANVESDISNYGLETTFSFGTSSDLSTWVYTATLEDGTTVANTAMFTAINAHTTTIMPSNDATADAKKWTKKSDGTFTYTISAADVQNVLTLNDIVLETKAEHETFKQAILGKNLVITVTAVKPTQS